MIRSHKTHIAMTIFHLIQALSLCELVSNLHGIAQLVRLENILSVGERLQVQAYETYYLNLLLITSCHFFLKFLVNKKFLYL